MKNVSIYKRLQRQYVKLNNRIQKSIKSGRFYQFTQFKQQQMLGRLRRYTLQLKQLGMGAAVVAAVGMATPVVAQNPTFVERTGAANPLDTMPKPVFGSVGSTFVDIDGDGDFDLCQADYIASSYIIRYWENTGTAASATFVERTGAANPFDGISNEYQLSFVDIDNDGDQDCFAASYYDYNNRTISFYENTGTSTSATFTLKTGANDPLDIAKTNIGLGNSGITSFVDIDNDGDQDCFIGVTLFTNSFMRRVDYYKNEGSASSPSFVLKTGGDNPLDSINSLSLGQGHIRLQFVDLDKDNDKDVYVIKPLDSGLYYENKGTAMSADFLRITGTTPIVSTGGTPIFGNSKPIFVDIDGDTDLDIFDMLQINSFPKVRFFENLDTTILSIIDIDDNSELFNIYPNPSGGLLSWENPVSGILEIANISGQLVVQKTLNQEQQIDVSRLEQGVYFLNIQTDKMRVRKKIIIQK